MGCRDGCFLICSLDFGRTDCFLIVIEKASSKGQNILASAKNWRNCTYLSFYDKYRFSRCRSEKIRSALLHSAVANRFENVQSGYQHWKVQPGIINIRLKLLPIFCTEIMVNGNFILLRQMGLLEYR